MVAGPTDAAVAAAPTVRCNTLVVLSAGCLKNTQPAAGQERLRQDRVTRKGEEPVCVWSGNVSSVDDGRIRLRSRQGVPLLLVLLLVPLNGLLHV